MDINTAATFVNTSENNPNLILPVTARVLGISAEGSNGAPLGWSLEANHPNPFNSSSTVSFALPRTADIDLAVFGLDGRRVMSLLSGSLPAGRHSATIDAAVLPAGIYIYRLAGSDFAAARKMVVIK